MTENRKRVRVSVAGQQRAALIRAPAQAVVRTVAIEVLPVRSIDRQPYEGPYEVTPGRAAVTLETKDFWMRGNVTVNPIPNNYGLIEWDGSKLRVS